MYFQKTIFVANPGTHQQPLSPPFSTAHPVRIVHPAGGGLPGKVQSGGHQRAISGTEESGSGAVHRGGVPVRKPKIYAPHPQSRLNRKPGGR